LPLLPPLEVPLFGTFWTITADTGGNLMPPLPCPPEDPNLPVYQMAEGQFLVDASGGDAVVAGNMGNAMRRGAAATVGSALEAQASAVVNLINQVQAAQSAQSAMMAMAMDEFRPAFAGRRQRHQLLHTQRQSHACSGLQV